MSLSYSGVAPIRFIKAPDLSYDSFRDLCTTRSMDFCQKVEVGDETNFQINLTPVSNAELISNGDFANGATDWTLGAGWSVVSEQLQHAAGAGTATQTITTTAGKYYRLTFEIISLTQGDGLQVTIGDGDETFTTIGIKNVFFFADAATELLTFDMVNNADLVTLDDVSIVEMSFPGILVRDCDDETGHFSDFDLANSGNAVIKDDKVLFMFNWSSITPITGCFEICVVDDTATESDEMVTDGAFTNGFASWTNGDKWTAAGGLAVGNAGIFDSTVSSRSLFQAFTLAAGKKYTLTFDILNFSTGSVAVVLGTSPLSTGLVSFSSNGSKSVEIDLTSDTSKDGIQFRLSNTTGVLDIDNVSIFIQDASKTPDACSECYCLGAWDCTLKFSWTQGDDFGSCFAYSQFDDGYGNSLFTNFARVDAKLHNPTYPKDKRIHLFSNGKTQLLHSKTEKHFELFIDFMPEYLHDALSVGVEHDTFNIAESYIPQQEDEYVALEEDYSPEWADNMRVGTATVNLRKKTPDCDRDNSNC